MKESAEQSKYMQMGMAALLPGLQLAIETMQKHLDEMRADLARMQNGDRPKRGRPAKTVREVIDGRNRYGWPADPEERKAEMKRRLAARGRKLQPKDPGHPDHERWRANLSKARKKAWAAMTPRQQKERLRKMAAGKLPVARLAKANGAAHEVTQ